MEDTPTPQLYCSQDPEAHVSVHRHGKEKRRCTHKATLTTKEPTQNDLADTTLRETSCAGSRHLVTSLTGHLRQLADADAKHNGGGVGWWRSREVNPSPRAPGWLPSWCVARVITDGNLYYLQTAQRGLVFVVQW